MSYWMYKADLYLRKLRIKMSYQLRAASANKSNPCIFKLVYFCSVYFDIIIIAIAVNFDWVSLKLSWLIIRDK